MLLPRIIRCLSVFFSLTVMWLFDVYIIFCFFFEQQWNLFSSSNKIFLEVPIDVEKEHELKK